jgi:hypothetical protein
MQATTKLVRELAKTVHGYNWADYLSKNTWTDKVADWSKAANGERYVAFRLRSAAEADKLAKNLQFALTMAGYTNTVKRTSKAADWTSRSDGGEYVRVKAVLG